MASKLEHYVHDESHYLQCIKTGVLAAAKGFPPAIAIEFARRVVPDDVRPTFDETEQACRSAAKPRRRRGLSHETERSDHRQGTEEGARAAPRRRVEGGLRRLRDGDDGLLPGDVARRSGLGGPPRHRGVLPGPGSVRRRQRRQPARRQRRDSPSGWRAAPAVERAAGPANARAGGQRDSSRARDTRLRGDPRPNRGSHDGGRSAHRTAGVGESLLLRHRQRDHDLAGRTAVLPPSAASCRSCQTAC